MTKYISHAFNHDWVPTTVLVTGNLILFISQNVNVIETKAKYRAAITLVSKNRGGVSTLHSCVPSRVTLRRFRFHISVHKRSCDDVYTVLQLASLLA